MSKLAHCALFAVFVLVRSYFSHLHVHPPYPHHFHVSLALDPKYAMAFRQLLGYSMIGFPVTTFPPHCVVHQALGGFNHTSSPIWILGGSSSSASGNLFFRCLHS